MGDIAIERITTDGEAGGMEVLVVRPEAPRGAVVLVQEAFGVNDHIASVAERLAWAGYSAYAPDLFHRYERRIIPYEELAVAKDQIGRLTDDQVVDDVSRAVALAAERDAGQPIGTVGFCFGGRVAFVAATAIHDLSAAVAFYGGGIGADSPDAPHRRAGSLGCPLLLLFGADDPMIPAEDVERVRASLSTAGATYDVEVYEGAGHGFACDARPGSYNAAVAKMAWARAFEFLELHLRGAFPPA